MINEQHRLLKKKYRKDLLIINVNHIYKIAIDLCRIDGRLLGKLDQRGLYIF